MRASGQGARGRGAGRGSANRGAGRGSANGHAAARQLNAELARGDASAIRTLVRSRCAEFNSVNCATALHRLAKAAPASARLGGSDAHWKRSWAAAAKAAGGEPSSAEAAEAAEAAALLRERTAAVLASSEEVSARSLTSIAWAVGRLSGGAGKGGGGGGGGGSAATLSPLLDAIAARARALLASGALDAYGVANVAWAIASLHAAAAGASSETVEANLP